MSSSSSILLFFILMMVSIQSSIQQQLSQSWSLLRLQQLLNYPSFLSNWSNSTDFCYSKPSPTVTIACYEDSITQFQLSGNRSSDPLPRDFSIDSFFTTLSRLPDLRVLSLAGLGLWGPLPGKISRLSSLETLNVSSNFLSGPLPGLSMLSNLQVLDLSSNSLGPQFPVLGKNLTTIVLRGNRFSGGLPLDLSSYDVLERIDVSSNRFVGPFMPPLLSLPSIRYIDISGNRFTGMLFENTSCSDTLEFVDLSSNLLRGDLPACLVSRSENRVVLYSGNCLGSKDQSQHQLSFCQNEALAVGNLPPQKNEASPRKAIIVISVAAVLVVAALLVSFLVVVMITRANTRRSMRKPRRRLTENVSNGYPAKMLADARYISLSMRLGPTGVPSYRSFSLEGLEAATNNFDASSLMGEGFYGEMYRGTRKDGSLVAIRCLTLQRRHSSQNFNRQIELFSKLRHRHLVSALGHCFEYCLDGLTVSRLYLIFEYVSNGTLRSNISGDAGARKLTWKQRIATAIGVAKGIQYLHAGIIPGMFGNNLKTTNILLDQDLVAKISSYNLPVLGENMINEVAGGSSTNASNLRDERPLWIKHADKVDIYDLGVILLEVITGSPVASQIDVETVKDQLQASMTLDIGNARKRSTVDPAVRKDCCYESLKTAVEICLLCLSKEPTDRPSIEDVLWNLQFAAQVQDAWRRSSHSSDGSSTAPSPNNSSHY